jgi:AraC family transcriptional regulator, regulatory protein of adaptative response / DNA-3-methyladenine glycosylase II
VEFMQEVRGLDRRALDRVRASRDPRFDGRFFIAVTSTGVYCRPICPSPTCKSSNVRYYATAAAAAAAGFRPCLRCRPEAAPGTPAWLGTSAVVRRALRLIHDGALDEGVVEDLAARVGVGSRHLHRLFMRHVVAPPIAVAQTRRLHFAKRLLDQTLLPMTQIALASGFGSLRRFNHAFHETYGRALRELRKLRRGGQSATGSDEVVLRLSYRPPYDWAQVRDFLEKHAVPGVEYVDRRGYSRSVAIADGWATIRVEPAAKDNSLELRVRGAAPAALFHLSANARCAFDLAADPALIARALRADPLLAPLLRRRPGLRIPGAWDPFECGVQAIVAQAVGDSTARTLTTRLVTRFGQALPEGLEGLTHLFPTPAALETAGFNGLGLPRTKAAALRAFARAVARRPIDFSLPVDEVIEVVAAIPGVGESTAQYLALRALGEPDALPTTDLELKRRAAADTSPLSARVLATRAESWRPWRSYAVIHLWCA